MPKKQPCGIGRYTCGLAQVPWAQAAIPAMHSDLTGPKAPAPLTKNEVDAEDIFLRPGRYSQCRLSLKIAQMYARRFQLDPCEVGF